MSWSRPVHNGPGIERLWFDTCFRSHGSCCGCGNFVNHILLLADRYGFQAGPAPPGGPRPGAAVRALPAPPAAAGVANPEPWRGDGGGRDAGDGGPAEGDAGDDYAPGDLDALFAAVAEDAE